MARSSFGRRISGACSMSYFIASIGMPGAAEGVQ
jgi:hypothetical protein